MLQASSCFHRGPDAPTSRKESLSVIQFLDILVERWKCHSKSSVLVHRSLVQFSKSDLAGEDLEVLSGQTVRGRLEEAARRKNNKLRPSLSGMKLSGAGRVVATHVYFLRKVTRNWTAALLGRPCKAITDIPIKPKPNTEAACAAEVHEGV